MLILGIDPGYATDARSKYFVLSSAALDSCMSGCRGCF